MSLPWTDNQGLFGEIEGGEHQLWGDMEDDGGIG